MWKCPEMVVMIIALAIFALTLYVNYPYENSENKSDFVCDQSSECQGR